MIHAENMDCTCNLVQKYTTETKNRDFRSSSGIDKKESKPKKCSESYQYEGSSKV